MFSLYITKIIIMFGKKEKQIKREIEKKKEIDSEEKTEVSKVIVR